MPRRFEQYRMHDGQTALGEDYFNSVFRDIDNRMANLEGHVPSWETALLELNKFGLQRVDAALQPALLEIRDLAKEGYLTADLLGTIAFVRGKQDVYVVEGLIRTVFAPTTFVTIQSSADYRDYMIAMVIAFDRTNGQLDLDVLEVSDHTGTGKYGDCAAISTATSTFLPVTIKQDMDLLRDEVKGYRDSAEVFKNTALASASAADTFRSVAQESAAISGSQATRAKTFANSAENESSLASGSAIRAEEAADRAEAFGALEFSGSTDLYEGSYTIPLEGHDNRHLYVIHTEPDSGDGSVSVLIKRGQIPLKDIFFIEWESGDVAPVITTSAGTISETGASSSSASITMANRKDANQFKRVSAGFTLTKLGYAMGPRRGQGADFATRAEAEAGTLTNKSMSPLRTAEAIASHVGDALPGGLTALAESISAEVTARSDADKALANDLATESASRVSGDGAATSRLDALSRALATPSATIIHGGWAPVVENEGFTSRDAVLVGTLNFAARTADTATRYAFTKGGRDVVLFNGYDGNSYSNPESLVARLADTAAGEPLAKFGLCRGTTSNDVDIITCVIDGDARALLAPWPVTQVVEANAATEDVLFTVAWYESLDAIKPFVSALGPNFLWQSSEEDIDTAIAAFAHDDLKSSHITATDTHFIDGFGEKVVSAQNKGMFAVPIQTSAESGSSDYALHGVQMEFRGVAPKVDTGGGGIVSRIFIISGADLQFSGLIVGNYYTWQTGQGFTYTVDGKSAAAAGRFRATDTTKAFGGGNPGDTLTIFETSE